MQNAKESLQVRRSCLSRMYLDWSDGMCGELNTQAVHVGFFTIQNEHRQDGGCRDGAGGCTGGLFLFTRLTESANVQQLSKWLDLVENSILLVTALFTTCLNVSKYVLLSPMCPHLIGKFCNLCES